MRSSIGKQSSRVGIFAAAAVGAAIALSAPASAQVTDIVGGPITGIKIVRGSDASSTSSTSYIDIPGAETTLKVTGKINVLVAARFMAESQCNNGTVGNYCSVRIVATKNGVDLELRPASGSDFAFDSVETGGDGFWTGASVDRSIVLSNGKYKIKAQYLVTSATTVFRVDDWSLTVETADSKDK